MQHQNRPNQIILLRVILSWVLSISRNSHSTACLGPSPAVSPHGESFFQIKSDFPVLHLLPLVLPLQSPRAAVP